MSKEAETTPATDTPPAAQGIRRGRIGLNVTVQIVLGFVLFVMVNVLGHRRFKQWDYTYSRNFSLAPNTQKFVKEVKEPVRISVLAPREEMMEKDVSPLLDQYKLAMGGHLEVEFIDTRRDVTAWENFVSRLYKMGATFKAGDEGILVQADRPHLSEAGGEKFFYKWIPAESLYVMDQEKHVPIAFRGESLLNTAIAAVTNPERPKVAVVTRMGYVHIVPNPEGGEALTYGHVLTQLCASQNIELEPWRMMENPENANRYKTLILVATTLFGAQQDEDLTKFFETPGNSVVVLLDPEHGCPEMDKWLARYGIQPQADQVLYVRGTGSGTFKEFAVDAHFLPSPVCPGLENQATLLPGKTRSIKLLNQLEKVKAENIQLTSLLEPSDDFYGEKNYFESYPRFDAGEDNAKPLCVAAAAERGAASDPRVQMQSSRLVVIGNAGLINPPTNATNYEFLTKSLNWCLHRDEAAVNDSSTDKEKHKFAIHIKPDQWQRVLIISTIVMPLAALMAGLLIWSTRRN
ncbi:MAG TPA: Gldg family protein [Verrucomicrobiales bacterium]|jgi:hypothetical protein|nr:Gldg family protein [Verrucomicrobiales bacterium]